MRTEVVHDVHISDKQTFGYLHAQESSVCHVVCKCIELCGV